MAKRKRWFTVLVLLTVICLVASVLCAVIGASFAGRAKETIRAAGSMDAIESAMQSRDYRVARGLNRLSYVFGVAFVILGIAAVVLRKRAT